MPRSTNFDLITWGEDVNKKLPELPKNAQDFIVTVLPWIVLIIGIVRIFRDGQATLSLFFVPGSYGFVAALILGSLLLVVSGFMLLFAFPKVQKRLFDGWRLVFWAEVLGLVSALLLPGPIINAIGVLIVIYLLYQIKSYYR